MSDIIEWNLELQVQQAHADKVQPLLDDMVAATQANEPGALHYEYYMTPDKSRCTVLERYADSDAVMAHMGNFGAHFADRFLECFAPISFTVYGPASDDVKAALAGFGATHQQQVAGFHR